MSYKKSLSLTQRAINLKNLVEDSLKLKFNPSLTKSYKKQLIKVEKELKDIKENGKQREEKN